MRKLRVRAFNLSLDGVSAEYGSDYFDWCMSAIWSTGAAANRQSGRPGVTARPATLALA